MVKVGKGQEESLEQSLEAAAQAVCSPQLILFFSKPGTLKRAAAFLADRFPDIPTMGLCSIHTLHGGIVDAPDILLLSFEEEYQVACGMIRDLEECPVQHIYPFKKDVESIHAGDEDTVCLEYCTGNEEILVTTLNAMLDHYNIPLIGATAFEGQDHPGVPHVAFRGEIYQDACIYALIRCKHGKIRTYYENIYMRTELTLHQVTKTDVKNRNLIELDGRPAADVYCDIVQVPREDVVATSQRYPLARVLGSRIFVAALTDVLPDGSLRCFKRLNPNDAICFMDYGRYQEVAMETIDRIRKENKNIHFTLTCECMLRYWLYENENFLEKHARNLNLLGDYAGIVSGGEQYHHQHINQSMVIIVFSHDDEKEGTP